MQAPPPRRPDPPLDMAVLALLLLAGACAASADAAAQENRITRESFEESYGSYDYECVAALRGASLQRRLLSFQTMLVYNKPTIAVDCCM